MQSIYLPDTNKNYTKTNISYEWFRFDNLKLYNFYNSINVSSEECLKICKDDYHCQAITFALTNATLIPCHFLGYDFKQFVSIVSTINNNHAFRKCFYQHQGCFDDKPENRDLSDTNLVVDTKMTVKQCFHHCLNKEHKIFGPQNG